MQGHGGVRGCGVKRGEFVVCLQGFLGDAGSRGGFAGSLFVVLSFVGAGDGRVVRHIVRVIGKRGGVIGDGCVIRQVVRRLFFVELALPGLHELGDEVLVVGDEAGKDFVVGVVQPFFEGFRGHGQPRERAMSKSPSALPM